MERIIISNLNPRKPAPSKVFGRFDKLILGGICAGSTTFLAKKEYIPERYLNQIEKKPDEFFSNIADKAFVDSIKDAVLEPNQKLVYFGELVNNGGWDGDERVFLTDSEEKLPVVILNKNYYQFISNVVMADIYYGTSQYSPKMIIKNEEIIGGVMPYRVKEFANVTAKEAKLTIPD